MSSSVPMGAGEREEGQGRANALAVLGVAEYLFAFCVVVQNGGIWFSIPGPLALMRNYLTFVVSLFPLIDVLIRRQLAGEPFMDFPKQLDSKRQRRILLWMAVTLLMLLGQLLARASLGTLVIVVTPMLAFASAMFLDTEGSLGEGLLLKLVRVTTVVAAVSLVVFLFGSVLHVIKPTGTVTWTWFEWLKEPYCSTYAHLYYEPQGTVFLGYEGWRNAAVFSEAPMFAYVLSLSLGAYTLVLGRRNPAVLVTLVAAMVTTFSVTAYILLAIMVGYYLMRKVVLPRIRGALRWLVLGVLLVGLVVVCVVLVREKRAGDIYSYLIRSDHIMGCVHAFAENPVIGVGLGNTERFLSYFEYEQGVSNGLPAFLALTGITGIPVVLVPFVAFWVRQVRARNGARAVFGIVFFLAFMVTATYAYMFTWLMFAVVILADANEEEGVERA